MTLPKTVNILINRTMKATVSITIAFCVCALIAKKWNWVSSAIVGLTFGHLWLRNLIQTQWQTLQKKETKIIFPRFFFRLIWVAIPVILSLIFSNYLLIEIILIFLFTNHIIYILIELLIRLRKNKIQSNKRKEKN